MSGDGAIGVFDSGVGGLTVLHEIVRVLPAEDTVYLGDTGRYPYGTKSAETIVQFSIENVEFLVARGIKLLVVACNSVSAVALEAIRARFSIPVIGVIEPGARAAVARTRVGRVGVIGTDATIGSGAYTRALWAMAPSLEILVRACPLLVPLAEEGWTEGPIARQIVDTYLASLGRSGIDTLILGCTHYPLLRPLIADAMGAAVEIVDSAEETAREVATRIAAEGLATTRGEGRASFFVTDVPERFVRLGHRFFGAAIQSAVRIER